MIDKKHQLPTVVIFGRTNVGKSTLFNRLTERPQALVADIEGTTRDSNYGEVEWQRIKFTLIDTGGIIDIGYLTGRRQETGDIESKVQTQARALLGRADLILFLVDNKAGLLPPDREMALTIKKMLPDHTHVLLVANKVDSPGSRPKTAQFHKLALGEPILVSAINGTGTGDLLDIVTDRLKNAGTLEDIPDHPAASPVRAAIVGKPNVGKSSLLNAILGESRVIVSPTPHTTREPQDTDIVYHDHVITLVDTAGISKKGMQQPRTKKSDTLEKRGIAKSLSALDRSDIALLVLDISQDITHQDQKIVEEIIRRRKSLVIIANKWDLIEDKNTKTYSDYIRSHLPFAAWAPVHFLSALTGAKTNKVLDLILEIDSERRKELSQSSLNGFLKAIVKRHLPTKGRGVKPPRVYEIIQEKTNPPGFTVRIGTKDSLRESYVRFIENRLREKFGFIGTPIGFYVKKGRN